MDGSQPLPHDRDQGGLTPRRPISENIIAGLLRCVDIAAVLVAGLVAYIAYLHPRPVEVEQRYFVLMLVTAFVCVSAFHLANVYGPSTLRLLGFQLRRILTAWTGVTMIMLVIGFLTKTTEDYSRVWIISTYLGAASVLVASRVVVAELVRAWIRSGRLQRRVVVVGAGEHGARFIKMLVDTQDRGLRVLGVFDDRATRVPADVHGVPVLGNISDLLRFARENPLDMVIVAMPWSAELRLLTILRRLRELPIDVRLATDMVGFQLRNRRMSQIGGLPVLNVFERPLKDWNAIVKSVEDFALALVITVAVAPALLFIALAIKLDSRGPVLFRQKRYGFNNELVEVYKFRTMYIDKSDANAVTLVTRGDPRVTRLGRILRRTSLDELPQLINVLRGEMSLVGPRPHAISAKAQDQLYAEVVAEYAARHRVKPGITGWAQVNGWRGETDTIEKIQKRVEHDLYYIDNWSLYLDLRILLLTFYRGFTGANAY